MFKKCQKCFILGLKNWGNFEKKKDYGNKTTECVQ
jgi:hypothetical protein